MINRLGLRCLRAAVLLALWFLAGIIGCQQKTASSKLASIPSPVTRLVFSSDGKKLAAVAGAQVKVWQVDSGKELHAFPSPSGIVRSVALSPDGKTLAAGMNQTLELWDLADGKKTSSLEGHKAPIIGLAFSADGKTVVSVACLYTFST